MILAELCSLLSIFIVFLKQDYSVKALAPGTPFVNQAGFELRDLCLPRVLGLKSFTTTAQLFLRHSYYVAKIDLKFLGSSKPFMSASQTHQTADTCYLSRMLVSHSVKL